MASYVRIHKAWAKEVAKKDTVDLREKYNETVKADPQIAKVLTFKQYCGNAQSDAVQALNSTNAAICYYFTNEFKGEMTFNNERSKTVWQTVKANANYYQNVIGFIQEENDPEYTKIYDAIRVKLESYFNLAAEDILEDVYGKEYIDFKAKKLTAKSKKK